MEHHTKFGELPQVCTNFIPDFSLRLLFSQKSICKETVSVWRTSRTSCIPLCCCELLQVLRPKSSIPISVKSSLHRTQLRPVCAQRPY